MSLTILKSGVHPRESVDPFAQLPCVHEEVIVHITNSETMGGDLLECPECQYVLSLSDLYAAVQMPPGL